jgi:ribosomal protein L37AE/L43A
MSVPKTHCRGGVLRHVFERIARDKWACTECDEPYTGQKDAIFIQSIQCPKCGAVWDDGRFNACGCYTREVTGIVAGAARKFSRD